MRRAPFARLASVVAVVALAACTEQPGAGSVGFATALDPKAESLLQELLHAHETTVHRGVRRIEQHVELGDGEALDLVYTEEIATDGTGRFRIETLDASTPVEPSLYDFLAMQDIRQAFTFRYRDFRIRDLGLFLENYQLQDLGQLVQVAGRTCAQYVVRGFNAEDRIYRVAIDVETGLVLRWSEEDLAGAVSYRMEYLSYDATPDLDDVVWHDPSNQEQPIDLLDDPKDELGFEPFVPKVPPPGYELVASTTVVDHELRTWLKLELGDGVETAFFLHGGPTSAGIGGATATSANPGFVGAGPAAGQGRILTFRVGALSVAQGTWAGHEVIAVGKFPIDDLLGMIESALP